MSLVGIKDDQGHFEVVDEDSTIKITPKKNPSYNEDIPWQVIILSIVGCIFIIYTAIGPGINTSRRLFGIIFIGIWTIIWAIMLFILWNERYIEQSWWLLLVPIGILVIFFILVVILDIGNK